DVHRESLESPRAEEEHAVGHFLADSGEFAEALLRCGVRERLRFLEPAGMRRQEVRCLCDVARAKTEQARSELRLAAFRQFGPCWKPEESGCNLRPVARREQGHHL